MNRIALLILVIGCVQLCAAREGTLPNLVTNPGFEEVDANGAPVAWPVDNDVYTVVDSPTHSGQRALQYRRTNPQSYVLREQPIKLEPGRAYEFSVWVKTDNVQGDEMGATICLQYYGADGKWIGGSYPAGFRGTTDWTQLRAISGRVPPGTASAGVLCYLRRGMTGTAWFDDVEVRQWREPPLSTLLLRPRYRGEIWPQTRLIEAEATLKLDDWKLRPRDVIVRTELIRRSDNQVVDTRRWIPRGTAVYLPVPTAGLQQGKYLLKITVERADTWAPLGSETWRLNVVDPAALARRVSYVDESNTLIREGKPFFPLGMYWSGVSEEDLRVYADSPFNCLMPYGAPTRQHMDLAHQLGLKVIYTVKDIYFGSQYCPADIQTIEDERRFIEQKAAEFKDHPALLAWYVNDELGLEYRDRLEAHQEWLEDLDPDHPTWAVLWQVHQLTDYLRTCDVLGTDPYPIPHGPARMAGEWARMTVNAGRSMRPAWMVPQVFNWACYRADEDKAGLRPPTVDEMRSMAWQCIVHGAKGLIFYSWFDIKRDTVVPFEEQWARVKQMAGEIKALIPVILSRQPTPAFRVRERPWLHWTTRALGNAVYLMAVNDEPYRRTATFDLGAHPRRCVSQGPTCEARLGEDGKLTLDFQPHGVGIVRLQF